MKTHGVSTFKLEGLEVSFEPLKAPIEAPSTLVEVDETHVPPDLKGDDLFNQDKVLFWSSGGEGDSPDMPLTGEDRLAAP